MKTLDDLASYYELRAKQCQHMAWAMWQQHHYGWTDGAWGNLVEWAEAMCEADELARDLQIYTDCEDWRTELLLRQARGLR